MSEENKNTYEVGIPLDELPPQESSDLEPSMAGSETDTLPSEDDMDSPEEAVGLPDLFDPEELAEVGLTAELAEPREQEEDNSSSLLPEATEDSAAGISTAEIAPEDPDGGKTVDELSLDSTEDDRLEAELALESQISLDDPHGAESDDDSAPAAVYRSADDDDLIDEDGSAVASEHSEGGDSVHHGESAVIDQDLLTGRLETLGLQIEELKREFEGKLKYDAHKDEVIDRLHSELQEYKQDIIKKYVLSIVMDVVKVADDIRKWLAYFRSLDVSQRDPRKLFRYLEAIPSDLEDVFYWHGVKPFSQQEGAFDPARQRAIKKVPTDDPDLDKSVAHSIRPGYEWETKVIRQEMVAVYVYQEKQESLDTGMIDE